jgi:hypothetical protein
MVLGDERCHRIVKKSTRMNTRTMKMSMMMKRMRRMTTTTTKIRTHKRLHLVNVTYRLERRYRDDPMAEKISSILET